jgi:hypothetical protein
MLKQHRPRRWLLGSLLGLVLAVATLGTGHEVSAVTVPFPDFGSKEAFRRYCELQGGEFGEAGGGTYCLVSGRAWTECDANGNNCTITTVVGQLPGGGANSPDGTGEQNEGDGGGTGFPGLPGQTPPDTLPNLPSNND